MDRLGEVDLTLDFQRKKGEKRLAAAQERLAALRLTLGGQIGSGKIGPPVCVVIEGWDAAGKGGTIKRLTYPLDPRHARVVQFAAPTPDEKRHHFLGRFWPSLPGWGGMAVFDRSWYGRVLVERVEGYATKKEWKRSYREIRNFEQGITDEGTILIKLWLHMSEEEQLRRFEARAEDPLKTWKLTEDDWRNREKRPDYIEAIEDMFDKTDTEAAAWHVIPSESKRYSRVAVIETVNAEIEAGLKRWGFKLPSLD
ncbi:MAG: UDP-galactose-lipid carrier transferase [Thermoleophilia bacterium]|nr:UDP-galactose-lipid carrier transferase [Thermoleophilia bacterium]